MQSVIETVCKELATEIGGRVLRPNPGMRFKQRGTLYSVIGKFKERAVLVDIEPWGEMTLKLDCNINYRFQIRSNSFLARISLFAAKRIFTGDKEFDRSFIVRSNNYYGVSTWLMHREIREAIFTLMPFSDLAFRKNLLRYMSDIELDRPRTDEISKRIRVLNDIAVSLETAH